MRVSIVHIVSFLIVGAMTASAFAQVTTLSVRVSEVNCVDVPGGAPANAITAQPGDVLTVELFMRDWSPAGQELRGYELAFDFDSYQSGLVGNLFPRDFATTTDLNGLCTAGGTIGILNPTNCFNDGADCFGSDSDPVGSDFGANWCVDTPCSFPFDCIDPPTGTGACVAPSIDWIHGEVISAANTAVNSVLCGYRYISGLNAGVAGRVSLQDGTEYYAGSTVLVVSADAAGTFNICMNDIDANQDGEPDKSFLRDTSNTPIIPIAFECVAVTIAAGACCEGTAPNETCSITNQASCAGAWTENALCPAPDQCPCFSDAECDDGNACTLDDCTPQAVCANTPTFDDITQCCNPTDGTLTTIDDALECTTDACDPATGNVTNDPVPVGTGCGDGNDTTCDGADTCDAGGNCNANLASSGTPCGDPTVDDCTAADTCDGVGSCDANHAANGAICHDTLFCNEGEACLGGVCTGGTTVNCGDGLPCTTDVCNETTDQCDSTLDAGFCLIGNVCHADGDPNPANGCEACDSATSTSAWTPRPMGSLCDDNNSCTLSDVCDGAGGCAGTVDPECNDLCADAIEAFQGANVGNNTTATIDDGFASCQPNSSHDVWFRFTALCNGLFTMNTVGSNFLPVNDPVLSILDGCGGNEIACDDDSGSGFHASVTFVATSLTTYWIRVAGFDGNAGDVVLNILPVDECFINGVCYTEGTPNPSNPCVACIPVISSTSWSNQFKGTPCGDPSFSECDNPDACDGAGVCENNHKLDGTRCSDDGNDCTSDACEIGVCEHPPLAALTTCGNPDDTECDNPDTCDGASVCLPNHEPNGLACGDPADSDCDHADSCNGAGSCSVNFEPDSTPCTDDGNDCTFDDCQSGLCEHPNKPALAICGDPTDTECDNPDACDGGGVCLPNSEPDGTPCNDADICTEADACDLGACIGDPIPQTPLVEAMGPRAIAITPQPPGTVAPQALLVTSPDWPCLSSYVDVDGTLGTSPVFQLPDTWGTIIVTGLSIAPGSQYDVQAECGTYLSAPGTAVTAVWADLNNDGSANLLDLLALLDALEGSFSLPLAAMDIAPCTPDARLGLADLLFMLDNLAGGDYPCAPPCP